MGQSLTPPPPILTTLPRLERGNGSGTLLSQDQVWEGADLRIHEDGEVYNVIFRFLSRFILGYHGSIEGFLRNLGVKFGQPVRIEG